MTETLMEVGMEIVAKVAVLQNESTCGVVDDVFVKEAVATCRLIVSVRKIADSNALRSVACPYPVSIRKI